MAKSKKVVAEAQLAGLAESGQRLRKRVTLFLPNEFTNRVLWIVGQDDVIRARFAGVVSDLPNDIAAWLKPSDANPLYPLIDAGTSSGYRGIDRATPIAERIAKKNGARASRGFNMLTPARAFRYADERSMVYFSGQLTDLFEGNASDGAIAIAMAMKIHQLSNDQLRAIGLRKLDTFLRSRPLEVRAEPSKLSITIIGVDGVNEWRRRAEGSLTLVNEAVRQQFPTDDGFHIAFSGWVGFLFMRTSVQQQKKTKVRTELSRALAASNVDQIGDAIDQVNQLDPALLPALMQKHFPPHQALPHDQSGPTNRELTRYPDAQV